jgi:hypothetical protein
MDFPLVAFQSTAKVTALDFFSGGSALDIKGEDFQNTSAVLINGDRSPTFVVVSSTRILADVPASQFATPIRNVSVLKTEVDGARSTVISFESAVPTSLLSPSTYLVQRFLKLLISSPGSDIFAPTRGAGILSLLGPIPVAASAVGALVASKVQTAVSQMLEDQSDRTDMLPEEKLSSVQVLTAEYSARDTALDVRLRLIAETGSSVVAGVVL